MVGMVTVKAIWWGGSLRRRLCFLYLLCLSPLHRLIKVKVTLDRWKFSLSLHFRSNPKTMGKTYTLELTQLPDDEKHIPLIVKLTIRDKTTKEEIDYRYICSSL
jgi:hypothetical protein